MKQRYSVRQDYLASDTRVWLIWDNQRGNRIDTRRSRREARAECQRLNAWEVVARIDQQQSREETI
jgi:hypothetical protein